LNPKREKWRETVTGFEPQSVRQDWNRATDRDWADVLAELAVFSGVGKRRLRKVVQEAQFAEYSPGESIVLTGAPADWFYVILGGTAQVIGKPGARELGTGDYFGEMALLDQGPRSATVVATTELHVMRVPPRTFDRLLDEAGVARELTTELGARVRRLEGETAS
jgi:CRP/FNR family cyclic AMP-dependent transcriptional regulator